MRYLEKFLHKNWLTIHIERNHHQNESNSSVLENPKVDNNNINNNNRTLLFGPSFSGKTYLM